VEFVVVLLAKGKGLVIRSLEREPRARLVVGMDGAVVFLPVDAASLASDPE
jgi:hypothetical protein